KDLFDRAHRSHRPGPELGLQRLEVEGGFGDAAARQPVELAAGDREAILARGQLERPLTAPALPGRGEKGNLQLALRGRDERGIEWLTRGDLSQLDGAAQEYRHLVAEGLPEP